jgi:hypothetical protein
MLNFVIQGLYDIQIKTNKFCSARMYSCTEFEKLLKKLEVHFYFLLYKIALRLKLMVNKCLNMPNLMINQQKIDLTCFYLVPNENE